MSTIVPALPVEAGGFVRIPSGLSYVLVRRVGQGALVKMVCLNICNSLFQEKEKLLP